MFLVTVTPPRKSEGTSPTKLVGVPISTVDRVKSIEQAIGKQIRAEELTPEESRNAWLQQGWTESAIDVTLYALQEYSTNVEALTTWTQQQRPSVEEIIGRPLRTFDEWAKEYAEDFCRS